MEQGYNLNDCFECGCCAYVCPSNIPLTQYFRIAKAINRTELYKQAAGIVGVPVPKSDFRSSKLIDGVVWDGKDPKKYAASFKIHA